MAVIEPMDSPENYRSDNSKFGLDMNQITHEHINRILKLLSKELRGGYYNEDVIQVGGQMVVKKTYVEDSRAAVCNAIESLYYVIDYMVQTSKPGTKLMEEPDKTKGTIEVLYGEYLKEVNMIEKVEIQKVKRYKYISDKLLFYKELFNQLLRVKARLDEEGEGIMD